MRRIVGVLGLVVACSSGSSESKSGAVVAKADAKEDAKLGARNDAPGPTRADAKVGDVPDAGRGEKAVSAPVQPLALDPPEPSSKPTQPPGATPDAMLDDLLAGSVIAYAPKDGSIAYAMNGSVEGTGLLLSLFVQSADGKRDELEICTAESDCETTASSKEKRDAMVAKLKDREWITLARTEWPEGKDQLAAAGFTVTWKKKQLAAKLPDGTALTFPKITFEAPHEPTPSAAYLSAEHRIVAVTITFDPGARYSDGFNYYSDTFVGRAK